MLKECKLCAEMFITVPNRIKELKSYQKVGKIKKHLSFFNLMSNFPFIYRRPELVVKKLRYYARFIVVCLLLNKMDVVKDLVKVSVL